MFSAGNQRAVAQVYSGAAAKINRTQYGGICAGLNEGFQHAYKLFVGVQQQRPVPVVMMFPFIHFHSSTISIFVSVLLDLAMVSSTVLPLVMMTPSRS